jgi:hypothetical protein
MGETKERDKSERQREREEGGLGRRDDGKETKKRQKGETNTKDIGE